MVMAIAELELLSELGTLELWEVEPVAIDQKSAADPLWIPAPPCKTSVTFQFFRVVTAYGLRLLHNGIPHHEQPWLPWESTPITFHPHDSLMVTVLIGIRS